MIKGEFSHRHRNFEHVQNFKKLGRWTANDGDGGTTHGDNTMIHDDSTMTLYSPSIATPCHQSGKAPLQASIHATKTCFSSPEACIEACIFWSHFITKSYRC